MLRFIAMVVAFGLTVGEGTAQSDPVRVVATLPVYADLVEKIGGTQVDVSAIAAPNEDAHFVRPKPSFALSIRRADLFITTGLDPMFEQDGSVDSMVARQLVTLKSIIDLQMPLMDQTNSVYQEAIDAHAGD